MTHRTRISGALLIVAAMLVLASLACYSGQIPGVFELTPYVTQVPLPTPASGQARFQVHDIVFTPQETRPLFNLTLLPETLEESLRNSKDMCLPDTSARVLYVGVGEDDQIYYLIECGGSAGWAAEYRLAGPLQFQVGSLALGLAVDNPMGMVNMLDPTTFQPMLFQQCRTGSVVSVSALKAQDQDNNGQKEIYYQIECPTGNRGWVTAEDLLGPLEISASDRALAMPSAEDVEGQYRLASEPGPVTEENVVEGDCPVGSILQAQEIQLVDEVVYYKFSCGDIEGWATQDRFVGPLLFDIDNAALIYIASIPVFVDQLSEEMLAEILAQTEQEPGEEEEEEEQETESEGNESRREVIHYTPSLLLTDKPAVPVSEGEEANVVGQCQSGDLVRILDHTGAENIVYYEVTCDECVEFEYDADGVKTCVAYEPRQGWTAQSNLQGPLEYVPGDRVLMKDKAQDEDGNEVALIPAQPTYVVGQNTTLSGRCPWSEGMEIVDVVLEKDRTRNAFSFYYQVQCQGDAASYTEVMGQREVHYEVSFGTGNNDTVIGWASARSLVPFEQ